MTSYNPFFGLYEKIFTLRTDVVDRIEEPNIPAAVRSRVQIYLDSFDEYGAKAQWIIGCHTDADMVLIRLAN